MNPDRPLRWIGTTTRRRDQGVFHLVATVEVPSYKGPGTRPVCVAACGAQPFAYAGSFADDDPVVSPGVRCQRCVALLEPYLCQCPNPECQFRDSLPGVRRLRVKLPCPKCGKFNLQDFLPVPR